MNRQILLFWCCVFFVLPIYASGCVRSSAESLSISKPVQTLPGEVLGERERDSAANDSRCATFALRNQTDRALRVVLAALDCSCSDLLVYTPTSSESLSVGDSFRIPPLGTFSVVLCLPPPEKAGERSYSVLLVFGDDDQESSTNRAILTVHQAVYRPFTVTPGALLVEWRGPDDLYAQRELDIVVVGPTRRIVLSPPRLVSGPSEISLLRVVGLGRPEQVESHIWRHTWRVSLVVRQNPEIAEQYGRLVFGWGREVGAGEELARVPVTVQRSFGISAPELVHFGNDRTGGDVFRRIRLVSRDGRAFLIRSVESSHSSLRASWESEPAAQHWLRLDLSDDCPQNFSADVQVVTDNPASEVVTIRVRRGVSHRKVPSVQADTTRQ